MKRVFARCLLTLICLAMSLSACGAALAEGYIEVIPLRYDDARDFSEGLAAVMIGEKWGFIDKTGKEVVPPKYDEVGDFHDGLAVVIVGDYYRVVKAAFAKGGVIDSRTWVYTWEYGFIDKTGKEVVPPQYRDAEDFCDGLARVLVGDRETGKWGFIDKTGKEAVPPQYDWAEDFQDGLAMVFVGDTNMNWGDFGIVCGGKFGFIDRTGKEVLPIEYDKVGEFHEGMASVIKDGKLGFVDETGAVVIPLTYEVDWPPHVAWNLEVMPFFSEGLAAIWDGDIESGPYGYIDRDGNVVIPFDYDYAAPFSEGLAYVTKGGVLAQDDYRNIKYGQFGFIDKTGEMVVPLVYDCDYWDWGIISTECFRDGFATVSNGIYMESMKYGIIDKTGAITVPIEYDYIWHYGDGLMLAGFGDISEGLVEGSWGLIEGTGREVVTVDCYDDIERFSEGFAQVWRGGEYDPGKYGFIDIAGKEIVPCIFDEVSSFSESLAAVLVDGKWGYIAIAKQAYFSFDIPTRMSGAFVRYHPLHGSV